VQKGPFCKEFIWQQRYAAKTAELAKRLIICRYFVLSFFCCGDFYLAYVVGCLIVLINKGQQRVAVFYVGADKGENTIEYESATGSFLRFYQIFCYGVGFQLY
jgi:hypothetical protein